jgi:hypothetical protein
MLRVILALGATLLITACSMASSAPGTLPGVLPSGSAAAATHPSPTPPTACAGIEVALLRVHVSAEQATGDVLDPSAGNAVTRTYVLAWPDGYSIRGQGGSYVVVGPSGRVVATDGSTIPKVQACSEGDALLVMEPIGSFSP